MNKTIKTIISSSCIANMAFAQVGEEAAEGEVPSNIGQVEAATEVETEEPLFSSDQEETSEFVPDADTELEFVPDADTEIVDPAGGQSSLIEGAVAPVEDDDGGFQLQAANLNDIFQFLAQRANKQYIHNNRLVGDDYKLTGYLTGDGNPLKQMEELAFPLGIKMYVKGNTVYALLSDQLSNLPAKEWTYSLNYLRPSDIEQIGSLIVPMLTPGRGIVNYEPKTNTVIVIDTTNRIEMVENLLRKIDKPKGQIVIETKILNVSSNSGENIGVDWSSSLGAGNDSGISVTALRDLSSVFGLESGLALLGDDGGGGGDTADPSNLILTPIQATGVLRALSEANLVSTKSNPVVITEDNETANISLIDRLPIITTTTSQGTSTSTITEEVRYTIDESDSTDPETTREIGVTISMTPSLLPDGTIRMRMRPRNAAITEFIDGAEQNGVSNSFPRVAESTIETIARIPDGHSLVVGGFYTEIDNNTKNKVPILGDVPVFNFFFKSKSLSKERSSLVFVVTPTSYDPTDHKSHHRANGRLNKKLSLPYNHDHIEAEANPGKAHEANYKRTLRSLDSSIRSSSYPER